MMQKGKECRGHRACGCSPGNPLDRRTLHARTVTCRLRSIPTEEKCWRRGQTAQIVGSARPLGDWPLYLMIAQAIRLPELPDGWVL